MRSLSDSMKNTQQALDGIREALQEPTRQMNMFGEDTKKSMETAKDAITEVEKVIDTFADAASENFNKIANVMADSFKEGEEAAKQHIENIKGAVTSGESSSGSGLGAGTIALGTAIGGMIVEAVKVLIQKIGSAISDSIKHGKAMDEAQDYIRIKSKDKSEYDFQVKQMMDLYFSAPASQTPESAAHLYGFIRKNFKGATNEEQVNLHKTFERLSEVYGGDAKDMAVQMHEIVKTRGLKTDSERAAETQRLLSLMVSASMDSKTDFRPLMGQIAGMMPLVGTRGWSPESIIAQMAQGGGPQLLRFLAFFGGGKGQAMDLAKTFNAHLRSEGKSEIGYYGDEEMKRQKERIDELRDRAKGGSQGDKDALQSAQSQMDSMKKYNDSRAESYMKMLQELSTGPEGMFSVAELLRKEFKTHVEKIKQEKPGVTDQAQIEGMAKKQMQANLGLVGIRAGRFAPALDEILRGSEEKSKAAVKAMVARAKEAPGGDIISYLFQEVTDDAIDKMKKWEKASKDVKMVLSDIMLIPLNEILAPILEVRQGALEGLRGSIALLTPELKAAGQAFTEAFLGLKIDDKTNVLTELQKFLDSLKGNDTLKDFATKLGSGLKEVVADLKSIAEAVLTVANAILWLKGKTPPTPKKTEKMSYEELDLELDILKRKQDAWYYKIGLYGSKIEEDRKKELVEELYRRGYSSETDFDIKKKREAERTTQSLKEDTGAATALSPTTIIVNIIDENGKIRQVKTIKTPDIIGDNESTTFGGKPLSFDMFRQE